MAKVSSNFSDTMEILSRMVDNGELNNEHIEKYNMWKIQKDYEEKMRNTSDIFKNIPNDIKGVITNHLMDNSGNHDALIDHLNDLFDTVQAMKDNINGYRHIPVDKEDWGLTILEIIDLCDDENYDLDMAVFM